jgi:LysM repeat protein
MSTSALASINGIRNPNVIRAGQVLKISGASSKVTTTISAKVTYHKVVRGETVSELAKRFGSSIANIKAWNHLNSRCTIYVNQNLRVK